MKNRGKVFQIEGKVNKEPKYKSSKHIEELLWSQVGRCEGRRGDGGAEAARNKMEPGCENPNWKAKELSNRDY